MHKKFLLRATSGINNGLKIHNYFCGLGLRLTTVVDTEK